MRALAALVGLVLTSLLWTLPSTAADAPKPRIAGLSVSFEGPQVIVSFGLRHAFQSGLRERIESGLSTSVIYDIQLVRDRKWWLNRKVLSSQLEVTAKYDVLTLEYRLNFKLNGKLIDSKIFQDLGLLERAMSQVVDLPAFVVERGENRREITLRVRADLGSRTIMSLIPTRITTDWAESRRFVPPT
ncbi:MAG: DUF4390 domain-containing protein [Deltaproteobacteria bacterium]|nr:DUF4390 domain-containing protein [Deltaproteobacteria bacterium]